MLHAHIHAHTQSGEQQSRRNEADGICICSSRNALSNHYLHACPLKFVCNEWGILVKVVATVEGANWAFLKGLTRYIYI